MSDRYTVVRVGQYFRVYDLETNKTVGPDFVYEDDAEKLRDEYNAYPKRNESQHETGLDGGVA